VYLKSLSYHEHQHTPTHWKLTRVNFGHITLLVGKNSSGKSRVLNVISALAGMIAGRMGGFQSGTWEANFTRPKGEADEKQFYSVSIVDGRVDSEIFRIKNETVMRREETGDGFVIRRNTDKRVQYKVDVNQLMAVVRSDAYQHPQFDYLKKWARSTCMYRFGSELGKQSYSASLAPTPDPTAVLDVSALVDSASQVYGNTHARFQADYRNAVVDDMNFVGYDVDDVRLAPFAGFIVNGSSPMALAVKERALSCYVMQDSMSQGMYRALAIIVQFNANIFWTRSSMVGREPKMGDSPLILIDDIGEGLDHERSRKLIKLLMDKALEHKIQLVMSTNDRYVMNYVSLEHWSVLQRKGSVVHAIDHANSKEVFEEFSYSGLSNFDFFFGEHYSKENAE
jgi:energy-coupling factor transporter ATP-binding protein EcfA2